MIYILIILIAVDFLKFDQKSQHRFECINKGEEMYLKRGKYAFDLYGAQGGFGYIDGEKSGTGGLGAHVYAECYITSKNPIQYYIFVGGAGVGNAKNPGSATKRSDGGFNGGGKGGIKSPNNAAGGGGGATDIRLNYNDIKTRQLVASGGSGGTFFPGNPGGALCGLSRDNSPDKYFCSSITNTYGNTKDYCKHPGIGQDGPDRNDTPCSGGGGGYCGGDADIYYDQKWPMTADSGTSYAKNCSTKLDDELCFFNVSIDIGVQNGDGLIIVTQLWECNDENCIYCKDSGNICETCIDNYLKHNGECTISCPINSYQKGNECFDCQKPCFQCDDNSTNCLSCYDGYYLYNNACLDKCPNGTFYDGHICSECSKNCNECSGSADFCDNCKEDHFFFENKCYLNCSVISNETNGLYYGKNENESTCQKCSDPNCVMCEDAFNECLKCSELYFIDNNTFECVHYPTNIFSMSNLFSDSVYFSYSDQFTRSNYFSESMFFSNSVIFSISNDFTESKIFSNSNNFTFSLQFSQSFVFTDSNKFSYSLLFSKSIEFTKSFHFSETNEFSKSNVFTYSLLFLPSDVFTESKIFSMSKSFSISSIFTNSEAFTASSEFSSSKYFSISSEFTKSILFTSSKKFTSSNEFSMSNVFTESKHFVTAKVTITISFIYIYSISYINGQHSFVSSESINYELSASIIKNDSQTYHSTIFICTLPRKKGITKEVFIGVICGCIALLLITILIFSLLIWHYKKEKMNSENEISISDEDKNGKNKDINEVSIINLTDDNDNDIDFWI